MDLSKRGHPSTLMALSQNQPQSEYRDHRREELYYASNRIPSRPSENAPSRSQMREPRRERIVLPAHDRFAYGPLRRAGAGYKFRDGTGIE